MGLKPNLEVVFPLLAWAARAPDAKSIELKAPEAAELLGVSEDKKAAFEQGLLALRDSYLEVTKQSPNGAFLHPGWSDEFPLSLNAVLAVLAPGDPGGCANLGIRIGRIAARSAEDPSALEREVLMLIVNMRSRIEKGDGFEPIDPRLFRFLGTTSHLEASTYLVETFSWLSKRQSKGGDASTLSSRKDVNELLGALTGKQYALHSEIGAARTLNLFSNILNVVWNEDQFERVADAASLALARVKSAYPANSDLWNQALDLTQYIGRERVARKYSWT